METDILIKEATRLRLSENEMLVLTVDKDILLDDDKALHLRMYFANALDVSMDRVLILHDAVSLSVVAVDSSIKERFVTPLTKEMVGDSLPPLQPDTNFTDEP